ncbi:MAG: hypothetical protein SGI77_03210 [Pirellulaceae bacterium]|nr:hypothetical protein [Pirellulaceae bacterium]
MTQIQAASFSALPQQAIREARTPSAMSSADAAQLDAQIVEKLSESSETSDRDAQEKYQSPNNPEAKPEEPSSSPIGPMPQSPDSIWNLAVADDQPPPDLDIRG